MCCVQTGAHAELLGIDASAVPARPSVQLVLIWADLKAAGVQSLRGGVAFEGDGD